MNATIKLTTGKLSWEDGEWEFEGPKAMAEPTIRMVTSFERLYDFGSGSQYTPSPITTMILFVAQHMGGKASFSGEESSVIPEGAIA